MIGRQSIVHILLPQSLRRVTLPMTNEVIKLLRNSSLLSVISVTELTRAAVDYRRALRAVLTLCRAGSLLPGDDLRPVTLFQIHRTAPGMTEPLLRVRGLSKVFVDTPVLDRINLRFLIQRPFRFAMDCWMAERGASPPSRAEGHAVFGQNGIRTNTQRCSCV